MASPSNGALPPSADPVARAEAFARFQRDEAIRAAARAKAQEAIICFADELPSAALPQVTALASSRPAPFASPSGSAGCGLAAASSMDDAAHASASHRTGAVRSVAPEVEPPLQFTPKRRKELHTTLDDAPSSEDEAVWKYASAVSQSVTPSSKSATSPMARLRLADSPPGPEPHGGGHVAAPVLTNQARPLPPQPAGEQKHGVHAKRGESEEGRLRHGDTHFLRTPSHHRTEHVAGAEPSAASTHIEERPNWDCMSPVSASSDVSGADTPTLMLRMRRQADLEADLEELEQQME